MRVSAFNGVHSVYRAADRLIAGTQSNCVYSLVSGEDTARSDHRRPWLFGTHSPAHETVPFHYPVYRIMLIVMRPRERSFTSIMFGGRPSSATFKFSNTILSRPHTAETNEFRIFSRAYKRATLLIRKILCMVRGHESPADQRAGLISIRRESPVS